MITGMYHTGFVVRDLEKATEFYRDVIGLKVIKTFERTGGPISQVVGYDETRLKITTLGTGEGHVLELIQYVNPPPSERPTQERNVLGASHLSFLVEDIQKTFESLVSRGARKLNPPVDVQTGRTASYLQDPDGNWLELVEQLG